MARTLNSALRGVWLMQAIKMSIPVPCRIEYTVRHNGNGKNKLRVRCGNFWHLIWANIHDFEIESGKSKSRTVDINKDTTGTDDQRQDFRWRLSRAVLTKEINWQLTYTVTRLESNVDATSECTATIANYKE